MLVNSSTPWKCEECKNTANVTIYPCGVCHSHVPEDNYSILCSYCDHWIHLLCTGLSKEQLLSYEGDNVYYACPNCIFPFHNADISVGSYFIKDSDNESSFLSVNNSVYSVQSGNTTQSYEPLCASIIKSHPKNFKIAHLNINSFKNKFYDCVDILHSGVFDIIGFSETKLGPSYFTTQYLVPGYKPPIRVDGSTQSSGLLLYFKDSVQYVYRGQYNLPSFQSIVCDIKICDRTWCILLVYRKPSKLKAHLDLFYSELQSTLDRIFIKYENVILMGDLNIDLLNNNFSSDFMDIINSFDMTNLVNVPTCYKSVDNPSLIDLMVTNKHKFIKTTGTLDTGLSDFHRLTYLVLKVHRPKATKYVSTYRAFKGVNHSEFVESLSHCPFQIMDMFSDPDDQHYVFNSLFNEVVDQYYPIKTRVHKRKPPPYMTKPYRTAIYKKSHLDNVRKQFPSSKTFEEWRIHRNKCVKLCNSAIRDHLARKCSEGAKGGRQFWQAVGPYLNSKSVNKNLAHIDLIKNDEVISNQTEVCNIFNTHFINKPANIGNSSSFELGGPLEDTNLTNHLSIQTILSKANKVDFSFKHVTRDEVCESIKSLKNKAPGHDKISAKVLKIASPIVAQPLTLLFNTCVDASIFPSACKKAEVTPGFKRGADTDETNYRPLSVLTAVSKVLEDLMLLQISPASNVILHQLISAYRTGHSCQDVLLYVLNCFTQALDKGHKVAAVATDLSSAFDCLPPNLMYHKLLAYGFSKDSAKFIHSYLTGRAQRVKIGSVVGDWMDLTKGTPQGSKLGPSLFNLFINDLLYYLPDDSVANFADDNTLYAVDSSPRGLRDKLDSLVNKAQLWYTENGVQSNPTKFQ